MLIASKVQFKLPVVLFGVLLRCVDEQFRNIFLEQQGAAEDVHDLNDGSSKLKPLLDDCDKAVRDDCDMNLDADGVLRLSPEPLDAQMLLDLLEDNKYE